MKGKLKIGIVGLQFGKHIAENEILTGPGAPYFELAAVCQRTISKADEAAARYGVKAYCDIASLVADPDIDVVGLYTGPVGRAGQIRQIIRAGKDVMTTKPFEVDPDAALDVLREARCLGRVVHLNSPAPLMIGDLWQIKAWIAKYNLGRPIACRADTWVSYREKADGSWYDDPEECPVAPIFRLGIYMINDIVRFFGQPEAVQVVRSRIFTGRPTPDNAQVNILFTNGAIASVFASFCVDDREFYKNSLVMNFANGTIYRNAGPVEGPKCVAHSEMTVVYSQEDDDKGIESAQHAAHSGEYQWEAFYRAVNGEQLVDEVTPEEIVAGLRIIRAMRRAELSGKTELV